MYKPKFMVWTMQQAVRWFLEYQYICKQSSLYNTFAVQFKRMCIAYVCVEKARFSDIEVGFLLTF